MYAVYIVLSRWQEFRPSMYIVSNLLFKSFTLAYFNYVHRIYTAIPPTSIRQSASVCHGFSLACILKG